MRDLLMENEKLKTKLESLQGHEKGMIIFMTHVNQNSSSIDVCGMGVDQTDTDQHEQDQSGDTALQQEEPSNQDDNLLSC